MGGSLPCLVIFLLLMFSVTFFFIYAQTHRQNTSHHQPWNIIFYILFLFSRGIISQLYYKRGVIASNFSDLNDF